MSRASDLSGLSRAIAGAPVVLDGGLATLLEARGHDLSSDLWSARLLRDDPEAIVAAHAEFFDAGAQVATTASYQASFPGFTGLGLDDDQAADLMRLSVALARRARDEHRPDGWVAASVGPYGAYLADGSEYRGDYDLDVAGLRDFHHRRIEVLAEAGPDVLAVETVPCLAEVEAVCAELEGTGLTAWLSLSADGDRTRAGEPLSAAWAMAADVAEIVAVGVNCCAPTDVETALRGVGGPLVAYPNSGQGWDAVRRTWTGESAFDAGMVASWLDAGARLVGGCCRVGPADIAHVTEQVAAHA
ncbi:MAG TPA: homocysteine S-methyltransferase [Nocardioides sp.]|uniref:homocysteine S-methyltransferase n=1 Tax=Nocardioides sp. TaxID=35761 RepID=UPI002F3E96E2